MLPACVEIPHPLVMSTRAVQSEQPDTVTIYGPGGYEHVIWRIEGQEVCFGDRICGEMARSEIESLEKGRHALCHKNHQLRDAVEDHQRQAREALSQAVRESSENCESMMVQEIQNLQDQQEGQMEDCERRVTHLIASEAQEPLRRQRNLMRLKQQTLFSGWREEKEFLRSQMRWEMHGQVAGIRKSHMMDSLRETSECERQAARNAQEITSFFKNEVSEATSACDSWESEARRLAKEKVKSGLTQT